MQNAWGWNPSLEDPGYSGPRPTSLTAAAQNEPPHSSQALSEDTQPIDVSRNRMVTVIAVHNLLEPSTDVGNRLVYTAAQFCFNCVQLCHHAFLRRFPPDDECPIAPTLPAVVREAQKRKGLRLSFSTLLPISGGEPPKLDQSCFLRM